jgi:hypothetical protein
MHLQHKEKQLSGIRTYDPSSLENEWLDRNLGDDNYLRH